MIWPYQKQSDQHLMFCKSATMKHNKEYTSKFRRLKAFGKFDFSHKVWVINKLKGIDNI